MIKPEEIDRKSREMEVNTSDVQRDYVYSWILAGIFTNSSLGKYLVLKGGNCLRKGYLENTRYSADLDFSAETKLDAHYISCELTHVCEFVNQRTGIIFEKEMNKIEQKKRADPQKDILEAKLYFHDFFGRLSKIIISVRLDITQDDKIYLPVQNRNLIHNYSDASQLAGVAIRCIKIEEILAAKLKCLLQRRHSADLFDSIVWKTMAAPLR